MCLNKVFSFLTLLHSCLYLVGVVNLDILSRPTDTAALLYDEQAKKPCRKFLQTGTTNTRTR